MKKEIYGTYKCERGEYECLFKVEYSLIEEDDSFNAHDELGNLRTYESSSYDVDIECVDLVVMYKDDVTANINDHNPTESQIKMIKEYILGGL